MAERRKEIIKAEEAEAREKSLARIREQAEQARLVEERRIARATDRALNLISDQTAEAVVAIQEQDRAAVEVATQRRGKAPSWYAAEQRREREREKQREKDRKRRERLREKKMLEIRERRMATMRENPWDWYANPHLGSDEREMIDQVLRERRLRGMAVLGYRAYTEDAREQIPDWRLHLWIQIAECLDGGGAEDEAWDIWRSNKADLKDILLLNASDRAHFRRALDVMRIDRLAFLERMRIAREARMSQETIYWQFGDDSSDGGDSSGERAGIQRW
jgi:hypothetical protein